mmetsp:Transcript_100877/g.285915  ORF Transcript_100877/g.285915 Transcript_100877/m.285915 type:complete len:249 (-) Transcript_100877:75-821(-)
MAEFDANLTRKKDPKWTMGPKLDVVVGAPGPKWARTVPAPGKYSVDLVKPRPPTFSFRGKPEIIIGDASNTAWSRSVPGPKYKYALDTVQPKQPVYSMSGGRDSPAEEAQARRAKSTTDLQNVEHCFEVTKKSVPKWSFTSKPDYKAHNDGELVPGPKYTYDTNQFKSRQPVFSMGGRLPAESPKSRSPGPTSYEGTAMESKKQELVDSTRTRSFSTSFGVGSRWEGKQNDMVRTGAMARYNRPCVRR